ncbi:MAG TPA: hypothetical protein PLD20_28455 [Blastocatellia bacterium]|nr:hypothetical protein [Blastocatellia bacterium]HMV86618.1 hypothetical protein [Blastocatellia bacterium]HMX25701.1 hypothetical protein [Blastocatellia bacterium]HMZ21898.1 hypothetical protein [Blastocatellia bacterium]HNG33461.1 hypothetical protein [Blastocatellia bacterium]
MSEDAVRDFLRDKGCGPHVVAKGLVGLVESWENVVQAVDEGYALGLDDYLNDLDARQLLAEALTVAAPGEAAKFEERIQQADDQMKSLTTRAGVCLWGDEVAEEEGWTPKKNWWYYARPIVANADLLAEINDVAGDE